ncbi:hypothetical protein NIES4102_07920 [Chondrocystis sp. NIES-4102]|nr:hypothetical protein NIES4102_07920 [Chondrocystis sp. NIES-4102]
MSKIEASSSNTTQKSQSGSSVLEESQNSSNTSVSGSNSQINAGVVDNSYAIVDTYEAGVDGDSYKFGVSEADSYSFSLGNLSADLNLSIKDSSGNTLYSSNKSDNQSESIVANFKPGTYTATISGTTNVNTDYNFSITKSTSSNLSPSSIYKFIRTDTGTELYTTDIAERDSIVAKLPQYQYQGEVFVGAPTPDGNNDITGIKPVYRFFNSNTGVHLYTASEVERDYVTNNLSNYTPEGISYYGYEEQQEGTIPLYRLYSPSLDAHFYTPSIEERDIFIETSGYRLEGNEQGITFYVQPVDGVS